MAPKPQAAETKTFYSVDGTDIRVTHPDGSVAIVGEEPRELPKKLWRAAIRAGCVTSDGVRAKDLKDSDLNEGDEAFTRRAAIKQAMIDAAEADAKAEEKGEDVAAGFEDSFTNAGVPNVRWLEKRVGFSVDASERDQIWAEVEKELDAEAEGEDEGGE